MPTIAAAQLNRLYLLVPNAGFISDPVTIPSASSNSKAPSHRLARCNEATWYLPRQVASGSYHKALAVTRHSKPAAPVGRFRVFNAAPRVTRLPR
jgi:hypothetical protein